MRHVIKQITLLAAVALVVIPVHVTAGEWTDGSPVGPSFQSAGQFATIYSGAAYMFAAAGDGILWQRAATAPWPSQNWNRLDLQTDTAPAAAQFGGKLYLFARNAAKGGRISHATYNGSTWSKWTHTSWGTISSPAVAASNDKLYLFWRDNSNELLTATLSGDAWSQTATLPGVHTKTAPAAQYFNGNVYIFVVSTPGALRYKRLTDASWGTITGLNVVETSPVALAVSNGKLFIFGQSEGVGYYRILDRTRQRDDFLPADNWVPVELGRAETNLAAVGFEESVFLFYGRHHHTPFLGGLASTSAPYVFAQSATWSAVPIAIVPFARTDCSQGASTSEFPELVKFADSVYNPLMIRMYLKKIYPKVCDDLIWNLGNKFAIPNDSTSGTNSNFFKKLNDTARKPEYTGQIVIFITNKSGGGGFSGFGSNYIYHPDHVIHVCNSGGGGTLSPYRNGFPHEIGHYAGLPHTFPNLVNENGRSRVAQSLAEVQSAFEAANYDTSIFDPDRSSWIKDFGVYDTAPDPLYEKNGVSDMKCTSIDAPVTLWDKRSVPAKPINLVPPRSNLMSYYQISANIINKLTRDQARIVYQGLRRKGIIKN